MPLLTLQDLEQASLLFHGRIGRMVGRGVMRMLLVDRLNTLYDRNAHLRGPAFAHGVLKELGIEYDVFAETPEVITQLNGLHRGMPFITISNHPYGSIDGVILADYFGYHYPDYKIMVNQMLGRIEALSPSFIPVTPMTDKHRIPTKESVRGLRYSLAHLRSGGSLGLFPAGAVSNLCLRERCICDREWQPSIIRFIAKARVPILPVRFFDGNSLFYYLLGLIDWRIRLLRLPAEVFNKAGRPTRLSIAPLISVEQQEEYLASHTMEEFGLWLRSKVEGMTMGNK
mgnify:CR=1 FL=1